MAANNQNIPQRGFVLLLFIVVVAIIATLWLTSQHQLIISALKNQQLTRDFTELELVRDRMLEYSVLQPEIYKTDAAGNLQYAYEIPSPGYFPCPDLDGNGSIGTTEQNNCFNAFVSGVAGTGFLPDPDLAAGVGTCDGVQNCVGFVPRQISVGNDRNLYLAEAGRYFYFVDERFTHYNPLYSNGGQNRFAPLGPNEFDVDDADTDNDPALTLNGESGYIMLIIDGGDDGLDAANNDGDAVFVSGTDDLRLSETADEIVGVQYNDWLALMAHRICYERPRYEGLDADYTEVADSDAHWHNDYNATNNPSGGDWRTWGIVCP